MAVYVEALVPIGRLAAAIYIAATGPTVVKFLAAWAFIGLALVLTFPMWITVNVLGSFLIGGIMYASNATDLVSPTLRLVRGSPAYVAGEETAILEALGRAWSAGSDVAWRGVFPDGGARVPLGFGLA
mgnify:CR=1 FL=1